MAPGIYLSGASGVGCGESWPSTPCSAHQPRFAQDALGGRACSDWFSHHTDRCGRAPKLAEKVMQRTGPGMANPKDQVKGYIQFSVCNDAYNIK